MDLLVLTQRGLLRKEPQTEVPYLSGSCQCSLPANQPRVHCREVQRPPTVNSVYFETCDELLQEISIFSCDTAWPKPDCPLSISDAVRRTHGVGRMRVPRQLAKGGPPGQAGDLCPEGWGVAPPGKMPIAGSGRSRDLVFVLSHKLCFWNKLGSSGAKVCQVFFLPDKGLILLNLHTLSSEK